MKDIKTMWFGAGSVAKTGLIAGVIGVAALTAVLASWALTKNFQALFTELSEQDASTMVAELDRMKVPYRLEADGKRIVVPEDIVHKTRLQLVGKNLPLHGAVGFEIFNNSDFGMTEFTQKVNYQRALQGELTRTIMAFDEVQSARVHLVLPETSLFRRDQNRPKASVTLAVKPGQSLERDQVAGVQRLIAAAVPGIDMGDVTVLDQRGVTMSRRNEGGAESTGWQLETKRQIEDHIVRKVSAVLDKAFGAGQGVVSVDALINFDQVKVTTEEVLGTKSDPGAATAGVVVRERQTVRDVPARPGDKGEAQAGGTTNSETDYQAGRRVEQLVSTPGSVRRLNIGVVVPRGVNQDRLDRIRQVVSMAAGLDKQRGDGIAVYSLDQVSDGPPSLKLATPFDESAALQHPEPVQKPQVEPKSLKVVFLLAAALIAALIAAVVMLWAGRRSRLAPQVLMPASLPLAEGERAALLLSVQSWLDAPTSQRLGEQVK